MRLNSFFVLKTYESSTKNPMNILLASPCMGIYMDLGNFEGFIEHGRRNTRAIQSHRCFRKPVGIDT